MAGVSVSLTTVLKALSTAKAAKDVASDKNTIKLVIYIVLFIPIFFLLIFSAFYYMLNSPLEYLKDTLGLSEDRLSQIEDMKEKYSFTLDLGRDVKDTEDGFVYPYPLNGRITSPFGKRTFTYEGRVIKHFHSGLDISGVHHDKVIAFCDGVVVFSGLNGTYGNCIIIRHDRKNGTFYSLYAHLSKRSVLADKKVSKYDVIGLEGGAKDDPGHGRSTGHHLHLEIRKGANKRSKCINPMTILKNGFGDEDEVNEEEKEVNEEEIIPIVSGSSSE